MHVATDMLTSGYIIPKCYRRYVIKEKTQGNFEKPNKVKDTKYASNNPKCVVKN